MTFEIGNKVEIQPTILDSSWKRAGRKLVGVIGIITEVIRGEGDIHYFLDNNKYGINFAENTLRLSKITNWKEVIHNDRD